MSYALDFPIAAEASTSERAAFIRRTYGHLAGAILAFTGLEMLLFKAGLAEPLYNRIFGSGVGMIFLLIAFIGAGWVAQWWASSSTSVAMQYMGLGLYVVVEAVIFLPLLLLAVQATDQSILPKATVLTLGIFGGLTMSVFITRRDYSYLGPFLSIGIWIALGVAVAGWMFGFDLGLFYSFAVVALACGFIIYDTSNVIHRYRTDQHVAAALQLFASVALLFYYILRIFLSSRD